MRRGVISACTMDSNAVNCVSTQFRIKMRVTLPGSIPRSRRETDGAITSDFIFESSLRLCPERYCVSDFFQSRWRQPDVEGATIVRALSNDPTGGLERFQSANQTCPLHDQQLSQLGNLEAPVLLQQPQDRELRNRQARRRQVVIVQAAQMASALPGCEGVTEIRSVWCCHPAI